MDKVLEEKSQQLIEIQLVRESALSVALGVWSDLKLATDNNAMVSLRKL